MFFGSTRVKTKKVKHTIFSLVFSATENAIGGLLDENNVIICGGFYHGPLNSCSVFNLTTGLFNLKLYVQHLDN